MREKQGCKLIVSEAAAVAAYVTQGEYNRASTELLLASIC